jgi:hypothetical protein
MWAILEYLSRRLTWTGIAKRVFDVTATVTSRKIDEEMFLGAVGDAIFDLSVRDQAHKFGVVS